MKGGKLEYDVMSPLRTPSAYIHDRITTYLCQNANNITAETEDGLQDARELIWNQAGVDCDSLRPTLVVHIHQCSHF